MSNPVADTAEFFAERQQKQKQKRPHGLQVLPSENRPSFLDEANIMSPESPESRRPPVYQKASDFDPKAQWHRVLNKLPRGRNNKIIDDDSSSEHELTLTHQPSQASFQQDDNELPSPEELGKGDSLNTEEEEEQSDEKRSDDNNYFKNPFHSDTGDSSTEAISPPPPVATAESDEKAKHRWGKTLDKVRLIANLHTLPQQQPKDLATQLGSSLTPYYPPLFDPLFISLSKDQHNHPWPPILLPFLNVDITDSELQTQGINQWVFRIELQYGDIKWVIKRTIADFVTLHYALKFKSRLNDCVPPPPNFPSQLKSWLSDAKGTIMEEDSEEKYQLALKRRKSLTKYLRKLLIKAHRRVNYDICEFLEISAISIVEDMGWKGKEGVLEHKINFVVPRICHMIKPHLWHKQWVILRDSYLAFIPDISSHQITDVFLFDKCLTVQDKKPGVLGKYHNHITLFNKFRRIEIKGSRREVEDWMESIQKVLINSPWIKNHRFGSFAPIRHNSKMKWFVDAEDHFNAVGEAILSAKSEIYICDWWLSPELFLRRPPEKNEEFRLDRLLKRKAEEGVKIYIVVYKEMAVALTINSAHTKKWLQDLHPNIVVVRHPDHRSIDNTVLFWSHHEKIVVVDNRLAFLGGLDLCWGRYDAHSHSITDYPAKGHPYEIFPGQDYSNPRVKDFMSVAQYGLTLVDRNVTPRMPWHDMTVGMVGPVARDVARHFIQRWNFLKASKGNHRSSVPYLMPKGEFVAARDESSFKGSCRVQLLRSSAEWSSGIDREHSIYNAYMECISKSKYYIYIENQFFISTTTEDKLLRNKIAQAIVERIKRAHKKGEKYHVYVVMPLIPAFEGDLASKDASAARNVMHFQYVTISRGGVSIIEKLNEAGIDHTQYIGWYSLRNWGKLVPETNKQSESETKDSTPEMSSSGSSVSEKSIWDDDDRKHYVSELVYIHDKIMIVDDRFVLIGSANINDRSLLGNRDSEIAMLIEDTEMVPSYMNGKEFKAAKFAHSLRLQLMREHMGLLDFDDWEGFIDGKPKIKTRQDLMDPTIKPKEEGSSYHHHEHTMTKDELKSFEQEGPDKVLNHEKRSGDDALPSQNFEKSVRYDAMAMDPLAPHFLDFWKGIAEKNTLIYRQLFRCVPDDTVHTFEQHRKFLPDPLKVRHGHIADPELHGREIRKELTKVQGHLVQFPYDYLKDENMLGSLIRETVTPMIIFT